MKRYGLFAMCRYYPEGGMWDFQLDGDIIEELETWITKLIDERGNINLPAKGDYSADDRQLRKENDPYWEIYDFQEMKVVKKMES